MKDKLLVIGVQRFDGEIDGKRLSSCKAFTITNSKNDVDHVGYLVGAHSLPYSHFAKFDIVPAFYDFEFDLVGNRLVVLDVTRVSDKVDILKQGK